MAKRVDRPIRLHLLTIFIVVAYGFFPFVSVFFVSSREAWLIGVRNLPLNGSIGMLYGPNGEADILLVFVSLFLCFFSAASAIWAFTGDGLGRAATLTFVSADVLWWSAIVINGVAFSDADALDKVGWALQLVVPPIWLAVIWWNFTRPDLNAYYRFKSETEK